VLVEVWLVEEERDVVWLVEELKLVVWDVLVEV
jgi:hypothetical protein